MNKKKVTEVVNDVIIDKLTQLVEEMSNQDFIEYIMDKCQENKIKMDYDDEEVQQQVFEIVGSRVTPLLHKLLEYGIGKDIPLPKK